MASLSLDERFTLVRSVGEECIQEDELRNLLLKKKDPVCYDGFEPSGRMHIAQVRGMNHNTCSLRRRRRRKKIRCAEMGSSRQAACGGEVQHAVLPASWNVLNTC